MRKLLAILLFFIVLPIQHSFGGNQTCENEFLKYYALLSTINNMATFKEKRSNKIINVKTGDALEAPKDKHSNTKYTLTSIGSKYVEIKFKKIFDARSFGGELTINQGTFAVSIKQ